MSKGFLKFINKLFNRPIVKIAVYILLILFIFFVYGVFDDTNKSFEIVMKKILSILSSEETLSIFLAGILSIGVTWVIKKCDSYLEESLKIEDNHHSIISKYNGHKKQLVDTDQNFMDKDGVFMSLRQIDDLKNRDLKSKEKDPYSKGYKNERKDIENFKKGVLYLPTLNVYANIKGDTKLAFRDCNALYQLPDYVIKNAEKLLYAHKTSKISNNSTIRLNDCVYQDDTLILDTQRSTYYHMLLTNRCMDFEFYEGLTIRNLYEYNNRISSLQDSKLGNQIGINGLIISSDGYVLIEKRDRKKTTWKNKFAQSISLALKESDLRLNENRVIGDTPADANDNLKRIISKTIKDNFGLMPDDYQTFTVEDHFLGLARDLLEGGKPNLYFYVATKYTAEELAEKLKENAAKTDEEYALQTGKLSSDYYLIPYESISVNYQYILKLDRRKCYWIYRRVYPRSKRKTYFFDKLRHTVSRVFKPILMRECGEALLVTIAYLELCQQRIEAIKDKKIKKGSL